MSIWQNIMWVTSIEPGMSTYRFDPVAQCNMCAAPADRFRVLGMRLNRSQGRDPRNVRGAGVTIVRCTGCGLVFPDPQPVPTSIQDHYAMSGEDYWQDGRSDPQMSPASLAHWQDLRAKFGVEGAPVALDVGVGSGFTAQAMIAAGFEFYGFEPIPQFRAIALRTLGLGEDRVEACGIEGADYPSESFDLINFGAVLEHLYDPSGSLEKALVWLRPGGLIVLEVPSADWLIARLLNRYFRLKGTNYVTHVSPMHSPFHLYEFTPESFERNGERLGYRLHSLETMVGTDPTLPATLQRVLRPFMAGSKRSLMLNLILQKR